MCVRFLATEGARVLHQLAPDRDQTLREALMVPTIGLSDLGLPADVVHAAAIKLDLCVGAQRAARLLPVPFAFGFHSPLRFSRAVAPTRQWLNRRCASFGTARAARMVRSLGL